MTSIRLYAAEQWRTIGWPAGSQYEKAYWEPWLAQNAAAFISNVTTSLFLLRAREEVFPVTLNEQEYDNSYVCSPFVSVVSYPLQELSKINSQATRVALRVMMNAVAPILRTARIDRVVSVNNWMLSTNLFSSWTGADIRDITECLISRFPRHAILFRSLNRVTNPQLCDRFLKNGYLLAPSRQVYLFDGGSPTYFKRPNTRWDQRLLKTTKYTVVQHAALDASDDDRIRDLYNFLYLDKYSRHNPQFSSQLIRLWREKKLLKLFGLRSPTGQLDGVIGFFSRGGVLTAPLVGYDTALPKKLGLYRLLMAIALRLAADEGIMLNLSSGAAEFKRLRGGVPCIEYTAVANDHLPFYQRHVWCCVASLLKSVGEHTLRRYQL